jgi:hypothetical protein
MVDIGPAVFFALSLLMALWTTRATDAGFAFLCSIGSALFLGVGLVW